MENLPQQIIELVYIEYVNKFKLDKQCEIVLKLKNKYIKKQIDKKIKKQIGKTIKKQIGKNKIDDYCKKGYLNVIRWFWEKRNEIPLTNCY